MPTIEAFLARALAYGALFASLTFVGSIIVG